MRRRARRYLDDPSPILDFLIDDGLRSLIELARQGDMRAARRIFGSLAEDLRERELTDFQAEVLTSILDDIANGKDAREATLTAPPPHRPLEITRDRDIFYQVKALLMEAERADRVVVMRDVYASVGKNFLSRDGKALSPKTVKNIYLRKLKVFKESFKDFPKAQKVLPVIRFDELSILDPSDAIVSARSRTDNDEQ